MEVRARLYRSFRSDDKVILSVTLGYKALLARELPISDVLKAIHEGVVLDTRWLLDKIPPFREPSLLEEGCAKAVEVSGPLESLHGSISKSRHLLALSSEIASQRVSKSLY